VAPDDAGQRTQSLPSDILCILDAMNDAVIACDLDFTATYWNAAAERLFGWKAEEAVGRGLPSLFTEHRVSQNTDEILRCLHTSGMWRGEAFRMREDGSRICIATCITSMRDAQGRHIGYIGVNRDVTDEKKAGDIFLYKIIDNAPYPILVHDEAGRIEMVNRVWKELTGFEAGDSSTLDEWAEYALADPEQPISFSGGECEIRTRWGTRLSWSFSSQSVGSLADGRKITILCAVDTTARRRAERARQDNADRFSALAEVSPIGIVIAREGSILYCNGAAERLLGLPPRFSSGLSVAEWLDAIPAAAAEALRPMLYESARRAGPFAIEADTPRWVEAIAKIVEAAAGDMEMLSLLDVTDRVLAEERERERMETLVQTEKLASLGILVAGVAHEINNPNYTIAINADILADAWKSVSPIIDRELSQRPTDLVGGMEWNEAKTQIPLLLSGIAAASRDIEAIVKGLKDYARAEKNPEPEEVSVNLVVKASLALLSNFIKKATRCLKLNLAEDLPPARAHFQRLEQVVVNLVQNACQALSDPDQAVEISTMYDPAAAMVILEVRDEGRGMGPEELAHVKDPFFTTKQNLGGVGLGVSISNSIITEFGGRLDYESEPGAGTRAVVALPAARAEGGEP